MKRNSGIFFELLFILAIVQVHAAENKERFCDDYAGKAVKQYEVAKRNHLPGIAAPAWSNSRNKHFYWCMVMPNEIVKKEDKKRQIYLNTHLSRIQSKTHTTIRSHDEKMEVSRAAFLPVTSVQREPTHHNSMVGKVHSVGRQTVVSREKLFHLKANNRQLLDYVRHTTAITPEKKKLLGELSVRLNSIENLMTTIHQTENSPNINRSTLGKIEKKLTEEEKKLKELEKNLNEVDDNVELENIDLQTILKEKQETTQMMSEIAKTLHETAMAVIRKMN